MSDTKNHNFPHSAPGESPRLSIHDWCRKTMTDQTEHYLPILISGSSLMGCSVNTVQSCNYPANQTAPVINNIWGGRLAGLFVLPIQQDFLTVVPCEASCFEQLMAIRREISHKSWQDSCFPSRWAKKKKKSTFSHLAVRERLWLKCTVTRRWTGMDMLWQGKPFTFSTPTSTCHQKTKTTTTTAVIQQCARAGQCIRKRLGPHVMNHSSGVHLHNVPRLRQLLSLPVEKQEGAENKAPGSFLIVCHDARTHPRLYKALSRPWTIVIYWLTSRLPRRTR